MEQPGLPIFINNSPAGICEQMLWLVKNSNLNFSVEETAFSLKIHLKKTFLDRWPKNQKTISQEFVERMEVKSKQIYDLENNIKGLSVQLAAASSKTEATVSTKLKIADDEKRALQIKHERICAENRTLKMKRNPYKKT